MPPQTASTSKNLVFSEGGGGRHTRTDTDTVFSRPNNIQVGEHLWMRGPRKHVEYHPVVKKEVDSLFASLWAVQAANLFFTLRIVALTLLVGGMGWMVVLFIRNVTSIVASTVSTASYIGAWALMVQAYRTIHMLLAYMPIGATLSGAPAYLMDAFSGTAPVPPPTTLPFFPSLDPRLCPAVIGSILSVLGCVKGR